MITRCIHKRNAYPGVKRVRDFGYEQGTVAGNLGIFVPEGRIENSPGQVRRSPLRRTALGNHAPRGAAPEGRSKPLRISAPEVARIVFDAVLLEDGDELRLEITLPVVLFLTGNVGQGGVYLRPSDREGPVALLPFKAW